MSNYKIIVALKFQGEVPMGLTCSITVGERTKETPLPLQEVAPRLCVALLFRDSSLICNRYRTHPACRCASGTHLSASCRTSTSRSPKPFSNATRLRYMSNRARLQKLADTFQMRGDRPVQGSYYVIVLNKAILLKRKQVHFKKPQSVSPVPKRSPAPAPAPAVLATPPVNASSQIDLLQSFE